MDKNIYNLASSIPALVLIKRQYDIVDWRIFRAKAVIKRYFSQFREQTISTSTPNMAGVLCVRDTEYVRMAVDAINSLHYLDNTVQVVIFCDQLCQKALQEFENYLDYPECVTKKLIKTSHSKNWQYYKLVALEQITNKNGYLFDADSRWFSLPNLNHDLLYFLTPAYPIKSDRRERISTWHTNG